jgi:tryptophan 2,3-dioxygenase
MPIIKPRTTQKHYVRHITRLYKENNEALYAYAEFIQEPAEYILNQLIDTVLAKDREFQQWRAEHPGSFVRRGVNANKAPGKTAKTP